LPHTTPQMPPMETHSFHYEWIIGGLVNERMKIYVRLQTGMTVAGCNRGTSLSDEHATTQNGFWVSRGVARATASGSIAERN